METVENADLDTKDVHAVEIEMMRAAQAQAQAERGAAPGDGPKTVFLNMRKCPQCGERISGLANLHQSGPTVQARCRNKACEFGIELFWLPTN